MAENAAAVSRSHRAVQQQQQQQQQRCNHDCVSQAVWADHAHGWCWWAVCQPTCERSLATTGLTLRVFALLFVTVCVLQVNAHGSVRTRCVLQKNTEQVVCAYIVRRWRHVWLVMHPDGAQVTLDLYPRLLQLQLLLQPLLQLQLLLQH